MTPGIPGYVYFLGDSGLISSDGYQMLSAETSDMNRKGTYYILEKNGKPGKWIKGQSERGQIRIARLLLKEILILSANTASYEVEIHARNHWTEDATGLSGTGVHKKDKEKENIV